MLDNYLEFLTERKKWQEKLKDFLDRTGIWPVSEKFCKQMIDKDKYIYLYHGTREKYVPSIKKEGLKLSKYGKRTKEEGDVMWPGKPRIYFSNIYKGSDPAGFGYESDEPGMRVKYMIAKLDTKYIKFTIWDSYITYLKDVPPKDLIWEDNPKFDKIGKQSRCLKQFVKGKK